MAPATGGDLWEFSLAVYQRGGVAPACLALQNRHGIDVNLLLFCCWLGVSGRGRLERARLAAVATAVAPWHMEVVRGLRSVRTRLGSAPEPVGAEAVQALRKQVAAVELEAEHIEQHLLESLAPAAARPLRPGPAARAADAAHNALSYLALLGTPAAAEGVGEPDRQDLVAVLAGCCPGLGLPALQAVLAAARP